MIIDLDDNKKKNYEKTFFVLKWFCGIFISDKE